jgi:hypothetical protein
MTLGMSTSAYTLLHVLISFIGIGSGIAVMYGFLRAKASGGITAVFLTSTVLTSLTGFGFRIEHLTPGLIVGGLSLVVLAIAIVAGYGQHLYGAWRWIYVVTASIALYFNIAVLIVQSFEKVPALRALAPTQKEPPFLVTQLVVMASFIVLTIAGVKRFQTRPRVEARAAQSSERENLMTREARIMAGVILITVPSIQYGGYFLLTSLMDRGSHYMDNPLRQNFFRAGHAHAGVIVILSLVCQVLADSATLPDSLLWMVRIGVPLAAILIPLGFFLSMPSPSSTAPNGFVSLIYVGAVVLAVSVVTLGVGLLRSPG